MKALVFETNGEPDDVLRLCELADPVPGPRDVVVRVLVSPVHRADLRIIRGRFGRQPQLPASPGIECVGVIEAVGSHVVGLSIGLRVILLGVFGTWRERIACAAERVEAVRTLRCALDYLASGCLRLPSAVRYPPARIADAIADAESDSLSGTALLSFDDRTPATRFTSHA
jgi:NADPH:quinone reductase-like Zn-dependent oxidoreductase